MNKICVFYKFLSIDINYRTLKNVYNLTFKFVKFNFPQKLPVFKMKTDITVCEYRPSVVIQNTTNQLVNGH